MPRLAICCAFFCAIAAALLAQEAAQNHPAA